MYKKDKRGNLVFDLVDEMGSTFLGEIKKAADKEFPGVHFDQICFVTWPYREPLRINAVKPNQYFIEDGEIPYIDHEDSFSSVVPSFYTLGSAIRQAETMPNCDINKVKIFWGYGLAGLCLSMKK